MDNINIEYCLLGGIISDFKSFEPFKGLITQEDFSNPSNRLIFAHMDKLINEGYLDTVTLIDSLRAEGILEEVGGISYITSLLSWNMGNLDYYVDRLKEASDKRNIVKQAQKLIEDINNNADVLEALDKFKSNTEIKVADDDTFTMGSIMEELFIELNEPAKSKIKTHISVIDEKTGGGLTAPALITIGALSSVGKTTMAMTIAQAAAFKKKKVLIISREMSAKRLALKYLISSTGISKKKFDTRDLTKQDWFMINKHMKEYSEYDIKINDKASTISHIKKEVVKFKPDLLIVDYLQLLSPNTTKNESREREVANLSRELKNMSQDHNMIVLQLSQLRDRATDTAPTGETCMRESRAIYQDSDIVIYIHRVTNKDELERAYNVTSFKDDEDCELLNDMIATIQDYEERNIKFIYVNVDKNRDGETGGKYYWFNGSSMLYTEA